MAPIYLVSAFLDWARKDDRVVATPAKGDIVYVVKRLRMINYEFVRISS